MGLTSTGADEWGLTSGGLTSGSASNTWACSLVMRSLGSCVRSTLQWDILRCVNAVKLCERLFGEGVKTTCVNSWLEEVLKRVNSWLEEVLK